MWDTEKLILILARFAGTYHKRWSIIIGQNLRDTSSLQNWDKSFASVSRASAERCLIYSYNDMDSVELCTRRQREVFLVSSWNDSHILS